MKRTDVEKVIKIILTANGGCEYCVNSLLGLFCKEFPAYKILAEKYFEKSFGKKLSLNDEKENQSNKCKNREKAKYHLHGWDDEKIYFWDDVAKKEYCVSDNKELYEHLLKVCIEYYKKRVNEK